MSFSDFLQRVLITFLISLSMCFISISISISLKIQEDNFTLKLSSDLARNDLARQHEG